MKTGILVALAVVAVASLGIVVAATSAHPTTQATGTAGGSYGGGMMNGGSRMMGGQYGGGMMGNGGSCPYSGNYAYCQQYMYENNYTNGECPMMG